MIINLDDRQIACGSSPSKNKARLSGPSRVPRSLTSQYTFEAADVKKGGPRSAY
jgi:hypothetical protein